MDIIVIIFLMYLLWKILQFIWVKIFVPGTKILWKLVLSLATILFFVVLIFSKELFFDALPIQVKFILLIIIGILAGVKYLKSKNH